jgi:hypothetical protein
MDKNKIDNLIDFVLNMTSQDLYGFSPDYIKEKWDKYIDVTTNYEKEVTKFSYINIWNTSDDEYKSIYPIILFIRSVSKSYSEMSVLTSNHLTDRLSKVSQILQVQSRL